MAEMRSQLAGDRPGASGPAIQTAPGNLPAATAPGDDEAKMRATAVDAMVKLGIPRRQAQVHVDSVGGADLEDLVNNAFAHRQSLKEGKAVPPHIKRQVGGRPTAPIGPGNIPPPASMPPQGPMPVRGPSSMAFPPSMPAAPIGQGAMPTGSPVEAQIAALGGPPGGARAAPSAEQLQQQVAPPQGQPGQLPGQPRNFYAERLAAQQPPVTQPPPQSAADRLRQIYPASFANYPQPKGTPLRPGASMPRPAATQMPPPAPTRKADVRMRVKEMKKQQENVPQGTGAQAPAGTPYQRADYERLPRISTQEEFDKLEKGTHFIHHATGDVYRKD